MEGTLLKSSSTFPYFMLVAFEGGGPLRALILLLLYPFLCLVNDEIGLKIMVFVSFVGIKVESFRIGRTVLPKFFLEDVGNEGFDLVMACGRKMGVSDMPRVMIDGFLRYYLGIEEVFGRELKVVCGYFVGLMEAKKASKAFLETLEKPKIASDVIGFACQNKSLDQHFFAHCQAIYLVSEAEKRTWHILPRQKYTKPLIFHDGRLAFRPTPLATLAMFMWIPFGFILCLIRAFLGLLLPYKLSIPILYLTGMGGTLFIPKSFISQLNNKEKSKGILYVCNHNTLFDPIYASIAIMKPLTAVTYSLSKVSEFLAPIKTVRLTRNRENDSKLIKELLSKGDVLICPEGTTCREPYLLRFSPLFAETSNYIVTAAINFEVSMFYANTAGGLKCLDPILLLMNPYITSNIKILELLTCQFVGKSKFEVANYVQAQIGKALNYECTSLTRKDKYMFLAGNEGII
ncbi:hypothetical protein JCGZ_23208 [Jatropha curcas]|uniref:Phospholipid/glycerol acyltransferase domain-containing protein n=2 Tax=Jatropha curcas TaxID=180498 RepID=A0A067JTP8_JATCU|nr:hypothetical protein JCGZ_23208 [Jatropha curcas]